jgi:hypothetical protein
MTKIEIKAQIKLLKSLLKHLCICELTTEGRIVIDNLITKLNNKLNANTGKPEG